MIEKIENNTYCLSGNSTAEEKYKIMEEAYGKPKIKESKTCTFGMFDPSRIKIHEDNILK